MGVENPGPEESNGAESRTPPCTTVSKCRKVGIRPSWHQLSVCRRGGADPGSAWRAVGCAGRALLSAAAAAAAAAPAAAAAAQTDGPRRWAAVAACVPPPVHGPPEPPPLRAAHTHQSLGTYRTAPDPSRLQCQQQKRFTSFHREGDVPRCADYLESGIFTSSQLKSSLLALYLDNSTS